MSRTSGVSEVIGSILLISLVGIAVAIVAVIFLSQPVPVETQNLNVIAGNNTTHLFLYHDGGDAMVPGEFILQFDTTQYAQGAYAGWLAPGNTWPWEIGEALEIPLDGGMPGRILIISTREGQETLIKDIRIGQVITPGPITPRPTPTPGPGDDCVVNFSERLGNGSVYFTRDARGPGGQTDIDGFINLTINGAGSYIYRDGTSVYPINPGAILSIRFDDGNNVRIFAIGDRGWSVSGFTTVRHNGTLVSGTLKDIWITSYTNIHSTLTFSAGAGGSEFVRLITNGSKTDEMSTSRYRFVNIRPSEPTLLILNYPSGQERPVFFIGQADEVWRGNTKIYPIP